MSIKTFLFSCLKKNKTNTSLESRIGYTFKNQNLKIQALTHKSLAGEQGNNFHNERLEFLGDAVLDLCISDLLMEKYPTADEGILSKMRASIVNTHDLSKLSLSLQLNKDLRLGVSESQDSGQLKPRLLACVLEALVGAVYLDGGYKKSKILIDRLVGDIIQKGPVNRDYKSTLQEYIQKTHQKIPTYHILEVKGPQHEKIFIMDVRIEQKILGTGTGPNKKQATQSAAFSALQKMGKISGNSEIQKRL